MNAYNIIIANTLLISVSLHLTMQPGNMCRIQGEEMYLQQLKTFHSMFLSSRCRMKACSIPFQRKSYIAGQAVFLRQRGRNVEGK